jgi:putative IMPACT (imprinted ancient) family translation regulator
VIFFFICMGSTHRYLGRLAHLMQILEVENVVVVVTRWFGGIHLGPDRFKDINNVARTALADCGFIKDKHTKGNTNSKSNKKNNGNKK